MGREWKWPLVDESLETAGSCPIKEYIQQRQDIIAAQVACRPIYELCIGTDRMLGKQVYTVVETGHGMVHIVTQRR